MLKWQMNSRLWHFGFLLLESQNPNPLALVGFANLLSLTLQFYYHKRYLPIASGNASAPLRLFLKILLLFIGDAVELFIGEVFESIRFLCAIRELVTLES